MTKKLNIAGPTLGDPFSSSTRSGVNYNVFTRLQDSCNLVDVFDLDLKGFNKISLALANFSVNRRKWGNKIHQNPRAFCIRSKMAERYLKDIASKIDLIYQDGAMFMPGLKPVLPFVSYHDSNVLLSIKGGMYSHGSHYKGEKLRKTIAQEKMVYKNAAIIFTMSDWLKQSLIEDFEISENKIKTVYAGTNLASEDFDKAYDGRTILFVGKNYERKGGETLLKAFKLVKKTIKDARLLIVGSTPNIKEEGVEIKGLISDKVKLQRYFKQASLFVMPSFFEPFGIVFAEAFAYKNPCIGTNICAMPEIIEEGKGGFLVPPNDIKALADRIIVLLRDEKLSAAMGNYGFEKTKYSFNWDVVVNKMICHCNNLF